MIPGAGAPTSRICSRCFRRGVRAHSRKVSQLVSPHGANRSRVTKMTFEPSSLRIGVVDQAAGGWVAAAVYSRTILSSLDAACNSAGVELFFLSGSSDERYA